MQITGLAGIPSLLPNDNLAAIVLSALRQQGLALAAGDVLVVAQKAVSKVENRYVLLSSITPCAEALALAATTRKDPRLVELVLREATDVVRAVPGVLIVRHRNGHVMANGGIDASNLPGNAEEWVLLLPEDADSSAARLRDEISAETGVDIAVVISDSFGRPWRQGVTNIALGCAGLASLYDRRNEHDLYGRVLQVTQVAVADAVAGAAGLVMGEASEGIPVALVRGLNPMFFAPERQCPVSALLRPASEDLFR
jgi:coenzyme F420-0:L-glutamate ligase/coenzyme F420-1:gamma-L-glutamate ligase